MRYGSTIHPEVDLIEEIERQPEEFDFLEITVGEFTRNIDEIDEEKFRDVLETEDYGLLIHLPFGQPVATKIEEFNEAEIDYLKRVIEFSSRVNAEKVVLHPNIRYREDAEDVKSQFKDQLKKLDSICKVNKLELCVENMPPQINCAANNFKLAEILDELNIGMCFDTGHGYASMGQEEMEEFLEKHSDIISHLHLQDTREGKDLHMPIGSGEISFDDIAQKVQNFDQTLTMEVFTQDLDYLELSLEKTRQKF